MLHSTDGSLGIVLLVMALRGLRPRSLTSTSIWEALIDVAMQGIEFASFGMQSRCSARKQHSFLLMINDAAGGLLLSLFLSFAETCGWRMLPWVGGCGRMEKEYETWKRFIESWAFFFYYPTNPLQTTIHKYPFPLLIQPLKMNNFKWNCGGSTYRVHNFSNCLLFNFFESLSLVLWMFLSANDC